MSAKISKKRSFAALASLLLLGGCIGLFEPEDPERPVSNNCAPDQELDATSPTSILGSLSSAIALRIRGRCVYISAFADSAADGVPYHSTFPAEIVAERERLDLPVPAWNRTHEQAFYDDFVEISNSYLLKWSVYQEAGSDIRDPVSGDSTLHRRYLITTSNGAEVLATGVADLVFHQLPSGQWTMLRWEDKIDPAGPGDVSERLDLTISQRRLEAYDAVF